MNELKEDRAELVFAKNLQQQRALFAVHQHLAPVQLGHVLAVAGDALVNQLVVRVHRVQQLDALAAHHVNSGHQVATAHGDVLNALAVVAVKIFLNLPGFLVAFFIDGNANFAAGAGHGFAFYARDLAFDVKVTHFPKVKQPLVKTSPLVHAATVDVVG